MGLVHTTTIFLNGIFFGLLYAIFFLNAELKELFPSFQTPPEAQLTLQESMPRHYLCFASTLIFMLSHVFYFRAGRGRFAAVELVVNLYVAFCCSLTFSRKNMPAFQIMFRGTNYSYVSVMYMNVLLWQTLSSLYMIVRYLSVKIASQPTVKGALFWYWLSVCVLVPTITQWWGMIHTFTDAQLEATARVDKETVTISGSRIFFSDFHK